MKAEWGCVWQEHKGDLTRIFSCISVFFDWLVLFYCFMQKSKGFKDHHFISFGDYLMRLAAFEVYFVDGQILYHLGMPAIFFYLGVFFKCWHVHGGLVVKNPPASAGDVGSIPGSGRSLGEGYSNPLQYSCRGKPMDRGAWRAAAAHRASRWGRVGTRSDHLLLVGVCWLCFHALVLPFMIRTCLGNLPCFS